jgi:hypothetical protein
MIGKLFPEEIPGDTNDTLHNTEPPD